MGMFDFIKDIGFGGKDDKEDKLESSILDAVQKAQLDLKDFSLKLDKGLATLAGTAGSIKDSEIARLIVGNHRGVEKVNDDALKVVPSTPTPLINPQSTSASPAAQTAPSAPAASSQAAKMIAVKKGDTLSKIAKEQLGSAKRYPEIFEANRPMLKDPDAIFPGQILRIPSAGSGLSAP